VYNNILMKGICMSFLTLRMTRRDMAAQEGFTLIELMLVIMIGGILLGGGFYAAKTIMDRAKRSKTEAMLRSVQAAVGFYHNDLDEYPVRLQDLVRRPEGEKGKKWNEAGYLDKKSVPKDAWSHDLVYRLTPDGEHPYELYSYGSGGKRGKSRMDAWNL
jgi:general secretion pathway protein G